LLRFVLNLNLDRCERNAAVIAAGCTAANTTAAVPAPPSRHIPLIIIRISLDPAD
jgi:hypothetical protein